MIKWEIVLQLHQSGLTNKQIINALKISRSSIQRILRNIKNGKTRCKNNNSKLVNQRLKITQKKYIDYLNKLYKSGLSQRQIAEKLKVHLTTIEKHFKRFNLEVRPYTECDIWQRKSCKLTIKQRQILDGILLGDGHLNASSVSARLTYGCKFRKTLVDIRNAFNQLHFSKPWQSKIKCWHFKSSFYNNLLSQQQRWYVNKKKIVPNDLKITAESCFWWFIGDGYQVDYGVMLCTDNFTRDDNQLLVKKLLSIGFNSHITSKNRIRIEGKHASSFLNFISNHRKIPSQYKYKWENHRRQSCSKQS